ncbi:MAG TPA: hypothetical protein VGK74_01880 [Symbiobacteriaceae bacterium]|jgi:hypothetical protein
MDGWMEFGDLAQSTGFIAFLVLLLWILIGGIIYWAVATGTTSLKEEVKYKVVEDDKPVAH